MVSSHRRRDRTCTTRSDTQLARTGLSEDRRGLPYVPVNTPAKRPGRRGRSIRKVHLPKPKALLATKNDPLAARRIRATTSSRGRRRERRLRVSSTGSALFARRAQCRRRPDGPPADEKRRTSPSAIRAFRARDRHRRERLLPSNSRVGQSPTSRRPVRCPQALPSA